MAGSTGWLRRYRQTGYQSHPTTSTRERDLSGRERLEASGIVTYFVDRTSLVRMQSFHAEPTRTDQSASGDLESIAREGAVGCVFLFAITPQRGHTRRIQGPREANTS